MNSKVHPSNKNFIKLELLIIYNSMGLEKKLKNYINKH